MQLFEQLQSAVVPKLLFEFPFGRVCVSGIMKKIYSYLKLFSRLNMSDYVKRIHLDVHYQTSYMLKYSTSLRFTIVELLGTSYWTKIAEMIFQIFQLPFHFQQISVALLACFWEPHYWAPLNWFTIWHLVCTFDYTDNIAKSGDTNVQKSPK